jgi:hypothetical protein
MRQIFVNTLNEVSMGTDLLSLLHVIAMICAGLWFETLLFPGKLATTALRPRIETVLGMMLVISLSMVTLVTHAPTAFPVTIPSTLLFFVLGATGSHLFTMNERYVAVTQDRETAEFDQDLRLDAGGFAAGLYLICISALLLQFSWPAYSLELRGGILIFSGTITVLYGIWRFRPRPS